MTLKNKMTYSFVIIILIFFLSSQHVITSKININYYTDDDINELNTQTVTNTIITKSTATINVACVFATGGLGDKSFNDMAYAGLLKAQADGLCTFTYSLPNSASEYQGLLNGYASSGSYDLIVAVGFAIAPVVNATASLYPSQPIVLIDGVANYGNVGSKLFKHNEGSFLAGALGGLMTRTGRVGFIGGMDIQLIREFWAGYKAGVLYEKNNSYIEVFENFVGDWDDPTTAKSIAEAMWADGVDIIFTAAGRSGLGVLESANEQGEGHYAIGVDSDQDYLYPGRILTSMMKRVDLTVYDAIKDASEDNWSSGITTFGLAENHVGLSPMTYTKDKIGHEKIQEVNVTVRNKIIDGNITIPNDSVSLNLWITNMSIVTKTYTSRGPIKIINNGEFLSMGFNGSGTINDPYIVEGYYINSSLDILINVQDTTVKFVIRNNLLNGINGNYHGIYLFNVVNGTIDTNTIYNCKKGIYFQSSDSNSLINNFVYDNNDSNAIDLSDSKFNRLLNNNLSRATYDNGFYGLSLSSSHNNTISGNTIDNFDIAVYFQSSHNLTFSSNIVYNNGRAINFLTVNNSLFSDNNIHDNSWGSETLYICNSHDNKFIDNIIANSGDAIYEDGNGANNTVISGNTVYNNRLGFRFNELSYSIISGNNFTNNDGYAIDFTGDYGYVSHDNSIEGNIFTNNNVDGSYQANDDGSKNTFIYNYWDDWTAPDSNYDGYVDDPYIIDGIAGNKDLYPLVNQFIFSNHDPIFITSNADFGPSGYNFPGNGTISFPYVIEGYLISNSTTKLIHIQDTTVHFVIRNNILNGINGGFNGISLYNTVHGTFDSNTIPNCKQGIKVESSTLITVSRNTVTNSTGSGIFINISYDNLITDNNILINKEYGVFLLDSEFNNITNNDISENVLDGIFLQNSDNNKISYNSIYDNGYGSYSPSPAFRLSNKISAGQGSGIFMDPSDYNKITGNNVYNNYMKGIYLSICNYTTIMNNFIYENGEDGIYIIDSDYNSITENYIFDNGYEVSPLPLVTKKEFSSKIAAGQGSGIFMDPSDHNNITGNHVYNNHLKGIYLSICDYTTLLSNSVYENGEDGIYIVDSDYNSIIDNDIFDNGYGNNSLPYSSGKGFSGKIAAGQGSGIFMDPSDHNTIAGNNVYNNYLRGIHLYSSDFTNIADNEIYSNGDDGLLLVDSNYSNISSNYIHNNGYYGYLPQFTARASFSGKIAAGQGSGIFMDPSNHNEIIKNVVINNGLYGIFIDSGSMNNTVEENDFFGNNIWGFSQAFDDGLDNIFYNNYWDDHDNTDANQDGIADEPYYIEGSAENLDKYASAYPIQPPSHYLLALTVLYPNGGEIIEGTINIRWLPANDTLGHEIKYTVYYSTNGGSTWIITAEELTETSYSWDTTKVLDGSDYLVMVIASCSEGLLSGDISDALFTILNNPEKTTTSTTTTQTTTTTEVTFGPTTGWTLVISILSILSLLMVRRIRKFKEKNR
ncbi:MAG: NosD domain-containing protein [Candidatus Hodarchaeales archaeon]